MARNIKTGEERIAVLEAKIAKKKAEIAALESQKYSLEHPVSIKNIIAKARKNGMSAHAIAEKLGIEIE
jgi:cell division protein FtsL